MKDYKPLLLFSIPYLTVSAGLYHLAFWSTFGINGLAYIGLQDVIKSFVFPFISVFILFVLGVSLNEIFLSFSSFDDKLSPGGGRNRNIGKKLNSKIGISIILFIWLITILILYFIDINVEHWIIWAAITGLVPVIVIDRNEIFHEYIENEKLRKYTIWILVYIPIFSFASGKYQSQLIHQNLKYKYTVRQKAIPNSNLYTVDTLKFIGNTDTQVFFTDINNSTIFILRADNIDTLILKQHD
jgi:hypothetical protein